MKQKSKLKHPKDGSLVRVVFTDHCMSAGAPEIGIEFEVVGRLAGIVKRRVKGKFQIVWVVRVWGLPDDFGIDENSNSFSLVESTISSVKILR